MEDLGSSLQSVVEGIYLQALQHALAGDHPTCDTLLQELGMRVKLSADVWDAAAGRISSKVEQSDQDGGVQNFTDVLPKEVLSALQRSFHPASRFWVVHRYWEPDTPFFSYLYKLGDEARNTVELCITLLHRQLQRTDKYKEMICHVDHVEWWAHVRSPDSPHQLHFDVNEQHLGKGEDDYFLEHPTLSSILFLQDAGGPTIVLNQTPHSSLAPCALLLKPGCGHFSVFPGNLLHGVLPGVIASAGDHRLTLILAWWARGRRTRPSTAALGPGMVPIQPETCTMLPQCSTTPTTEVHDLKNIDMQNGDLENIDIQNGDLENIDLSNGDLQNIASKSAGVLLSANASCGSHTVARNSSSVLDMQVDMRAAQPQAPDLCAASHTVTRESSSPLDMQVDVHQPQPQLPDDFIITDKLHQAVNEFVRSGPDLHRIGCCPANVICVTPAWTVLPDSCSSKPFSSPASSPAQDVCGEGRVTNKSLCTTDCVQAAFCRNSEHKRAGAVVPNPKACVPDADYLRHVQQATCAIVPSSKPCYLQHQQATCANVPTGKTCHVIPEGKAAFKPRDGRLVTCNVVVEEGIHGGRSVEQCEARNSVRPDGGQSRAVGSRVQGVKRQKIGCSPQGDVLRGNVKNGSVEQGNIDEGKIHEGSVEKGSVEKGSVEQGKVVEVNIKQGAGEQGGLERGGVGQGNVAHEVGDGVVVSRHVHNGLGLDKEDNSKMFGCIQRSGCRRAPVANDTVREHAPDNEYGNMTSSYNEDALAGQIKGDQHLLHGDIASGDDATDILVGQAEESEVLMQGHGTGNDGDHDDFRALVVQCIPPLRFFLAEEQEIQHIYIKTK